MDQPVAPPDLYLPGDFLKALHQRRVILFVGAGLSIGSGYPGWNQLVRTLVAEAKPVPLSHAEGIEVKDDSTDLLQLAGFARSTLGLSRFTATMQRLYDRPAKPAPAHAVIAHTDYRGIVTTNFDRMLETTITIERGWTPTTFTSGQISTMASALFRSDLFIYKLHGDIASPESIILTSQDYDRVILSSPHVRTFLQAIFLNYTIFFVGYSLRDPDFNLMLRELNLIFQGYTPQHYALMADPPIYMVDHLKQSINIQIIPYSAEAGHGVVTRYLQAFQQTAPYPAQEAVGDGQLAGAESA